MDFMDSESDISFEFISAATPTLTSYDADASNSSLSIISYGSDDVLAISDDIFDGPNQNYTWRQLYLSFSFRMDPGSDDPDENKNINSTFKWVKVIMLAFILYWGYKKVKKGSVSFKWVNIFGFVSRCKKLIGL
ncbi:uncharacterized protein LOC119661911 [Teleopsis dalmanni]|uniref:uncharacterized protein LOC119661911 n=1 Tax=Teleopsis dalmanni TaxID=139649 RepID=UPI000D329737|nr:uncharacterized protein LOC119661911 [Teleopsis dalmanni]